MKVFNPPGGRSSLNLGGYGGEEEFTGPGKIGARSVRPVLQNSKSAMRQYDMNIKMNMPAGAPPAGSGLRGSNNSNVTNIKNYSMNEVLPPLGNGFQNQYNLNAPR